MKPARFLLLAAALMCVSGCLPVSRNPLSPPEEAAPDARLDGVWYGKSGKDTIYLHFVAGNGARRDVVEVDHQQTGDAHALIYSVFPSIIGKQHYLNIREKAGGDKPFYLARYQLTGTGSMTIWLMGESAAAKAVKSKKLAGKITVKDPDVEKPNRDITLTATTEELAAFVRKSDPELLFGEKFGTFKKLVLPSLGDEETPAQDAAKPSKHRRKKKSADD
jgi:hypothetical protein